MEGIMRTLACLALLGLLAGWRPPEKGFTDITQESGIGEGVARHLKEFPKVWLSGLTLVDLEGQGALSLHIGSHSGPASPAAMLRNDGKGHFTYLDPKMSIPRGPRANDPLPYPGGEIRLAWDINEDGKMDLLCSWHDGGGALYLNEGTREDWSFKRSDLLDPFSRAVAIGDLNGDGQVDYIAGHDRSDKITLLLGKKGGGFEKAPPIPGLQESGAILVDLDGDGKLDLVVSQRGYSPTKRMILHNDGNLKFTPITAEAGLDENAGNIHGVGDLNGDGFPDLVCIEGHEIVLYMNDGKGHFKARPNAIKGLERAKNKPHYTNWGAAIVTDFDNDGIPDLIIDGRNFLYVLRGLGGGDFAYMNDVWGIPDGAWSAVDEGICFGDVNGDGMLDLVVCAPGPDGKEKGVALLRNDLPKRHWIRVRPVGKEGNRAAAGAVIRITPPGDPKTLLWQEQVAIWGRQSVHSYYAASQTERHYGLGNRDQVDVRVTFHPSGKVVERKGVKADGTIVIEEEKP
jgi:hypothetical protein